MPIRAWNRRFGRCVAIFCRPPTRAQRDPTPNRYKPPSRAFRALSKMATSPSLGRHITGQPSCKSIHSMPNWLGYSIAQSFRAKRCFDFCKQISPCGVSPPRGAASLFFGLSATRSDFELFPATALKSPESADSDAYTRDARRHPSAIDAVS